MKNTIITLLLVAMTSVNLWAGDKIKTADIKTKISCDHCKQCGSCSALLEKTLYQAKGIKRVDIDDKTMVIKVVYNTDKITLEDVRNTIASCGYDADDVKAPADAVAKLDGCCKGAEE